MVRTSVTVSGSAISRRCIVPRIQGTCENPECQNIQQYMYTSKAGVRYYRKICAPCHFSNLGIQGWEYKNHRKDYCENAKGRYQGWLGVPCCITEFPKRFLSVDHLDGDHNNNDKKNLMTLCHTCHAVKTHIFGDTRGGDK